MAVKRGILFILCIMQLGLVGEASAGYVFERDLKYDAIASSELKSSKYSYSINNVKDGNPDNAWCEGKDSGGVGEWMQFDLHGKGAILSDGIIIKILPGYAKSISLFKANERPSKIRIIVTEKQSEKKLAEKNRMFFDMTDVLEMQEFKVLFDRKMNLAVMRVKVLIENIYNGSKYEDMCISEVQFYSNTKVKLGSDERREQSKLEVTELKRLLPLAKKGNREALQALMRLVDGRYYRSAEGGEWLGENYLDIFYQYPERFLFLMSQQSDSIRTKVEDSIISPVVDTYTGQEIADKIRAVKSNNLTEEYKAKIVNKIKKLHGVK